MQPHVEAVPIGPGHSLRAFVRRDAAFAFDWHRHAACELTLIERGRGTRFVGSSIQPSEPGDLVLIGGHCAHTWLHPASTDDHQAVVTQFERSRIERSTRELAESAGVRKLLASADGGLLLRLEPEDRLRAWVHDLPTAPPASRPGLLLGILAAIADREPQPLGSPPPPQSADHAAERADRACRLIAERLPEPVTPAEIAQAVRMSPAAFARFFKRHTGRTCTAYIHHLRVAEACAQLRESRERIAAIAFDCGFGTLAGFNRIFRRICGCTPREYRARFRA